MSLKSFQTYAARISIALPALFPITLWVLAGFIIVRLVKAAGLFKVRNLNIDNTPSQEIPSSLKPGGASSGGRKLIPAYYGYHLRDR
jgi:hypothetical protein